MQNLPDKIETIKQLDEVMSSPSQPLINYIHTLDGDIMILGAAGKIGPTLTIMAKRAIDSAGAKKNIIAVARKPVPELRSAGIETLSCDLLDLQAVKKLPKVKNIVFMAGRKFGSTGSEWLTWAANCIIPHNVASVFTDSRISVFSTGCVYPIVHIDTGGSVETDAPAPVGEYSMSCLGRERIFDYFAAEKGEKVVQIRLNYALDLRYGVIVDIGTKVFNEQPVDLTTGYFNGIWQGDCCDWVLRSFQYASSPASILNVTGPEIISVRSVAGEFGKLFDKQVKFIGKENGLGYLNNASKANKLFGPPAVPIQKIIEWTACWIKIGGANLGKPTHFEEQGGKF